MPQDELEFKKEQETAHSGNLERIARTLDGDAILEHFGENSFEYLAYEHFLADLIWQNKKTVRGRNYIIPRAPELPTAHHKMLQRWIADFHERNGMELPSGFYDRDKRQLVGMFYGMKKQYKFTDSDVLGKMYEYLQ